MADTNLTSSVEIWKPAPQHEDTHEVSSLGRVRSIDRRIPHGRYPGRMRRWRGKVLAPWLSTTGYWQIRFRKGGISRYVHSLVLEAFVGPCPDGMECCHNDGNRKNAALANLRWDTAAANCADRTLHGTEIFGERNGNAKLTVAAVRAIRDRVARGESQRRVGADYGMAQTAIGKIVRRERWQHVA